MTGMMPDSGVPPQDARNSILDPNTVNCDELWYSTSRCQPRFDPAAANAQLAELINLVNCSGIPYDCSKLDNLCTAVQYLIQGGNSWCAPLTQGPNDYMGMLHPPLLSYPTADCCMAIKVIPGVNNANGGTRLNLNNLGFVPVVRNDGQPLVKDDWTAGIPYVVIYCGGRFINLGLLPSQVLSPITSGHDLWVRTDGSDVTGDGSANSADKAFRTISGAWNYGATKFLASPIYPINIRLGIPGTYESGGISPYGGPVNLYGSVVDVSLYRITPVNNSGNRVCFSATNVNLTVYGCTFAPGVGLAGSNGFGFFAENGAQVVLDTCQFDLADDLTDAVILILAGASVTLQHINAVQGLGGVRQVGCLIACSAQSLFWGGTSGMANMLTTENMHFTSSCINTDDMSLVRFQNLTVAAGATTGLQYNVSGNSVINTAGQPIPGAGGGTITSGGQVI